MWISKNLISKTTNDKSLFIKASTFIDRINKPLPPIIHEKNVKLESLRLLIVGESNIGKSTFIRFSLQNLIQKQISKEYDIQYHHTIIEYNQVNCPIDIIELNQNKLLDSLNDVLPIIHGALICYDLSNKNSLACVPDLLDYCLKRNIPTYLIGLKADQNETCQDSVYKLLERFKVKDFKVDALSEKGVNQMKDIFRSLISKHHRQFETINNIQSSDKERSNSIASMDKKITENPIKKETTEVVNPQFNKRGTFSSFSSYIAFNNNRRGSKDSSDSFFTGLTIDDIINRLLSVEYNKADENIIPIFLIFYRRFMKPFDLVKILVDRFKSDEISFDCTPSDLQKRIHSILFLWLSNYWNDFNSPQSRKHIILFLDDISKFEHYTPICDSLAPLVIREPPTSDPDQTWGTFDHEDQSVPTTPITPTYLRKRNEKKDSGYASGAFLPSSPLASPIHDQFSQPDLIERRQAEFAGGLFNIDQLLIFNPKPTSLFTSSTKPSSKLRWPSSVRHQVLASSFISSFKHQTQSRDNYKTLMKTSSKTIADQLTWTDAELFSRIKPREFIRNIWSQLSIPARKKEVAGENTVLASIAHFNFISAWIVTMIVTQSKLNKRAAILEKFMSVAVELEKNQNYNSLMAVLAGINSAPILRLKQTRHAVENKKIYEQFQHLEQLMSSNRSYNAYRTALKASMTSKIPYLGIHNQDLVSLVEANKDFRADGTIHWEKFRLMGETIMTIMKFKYPGYNIEPDSKILTFIADSYILMEDESYIRSTLIEPKQSSSSNTNRRMKSFWLKL